VSGVHVALRVQLSDRGGILLFAHPGHHVPATGGQVLDDLLADSTPCTSDEY